MNTQIAPLFAGLLPGGGEWIWIFVIILLLFGGAKLPSLAKGLGQSIKEFKKAQKDDEPEKPVETKQSSTAAKVDEKH
ncbi:MAG: twin-arginine translocase TatA/TatE family subunit [Nibricoccus sp.]